MGWFAAQCLEKPGVKHVTIVERDEHVLAYFRPPLEKKYPGRVTFIHGDAFKDVRAADYDALLYDVWEGCGHSKYCDKWAKFASAHPNAWAW